MKQVISLILSVTLVVSRPTLVVHGFHLIPYRVGISANAIGDSRRLQQPVGTFDKNDYTYRTTGCFQSSPLFASPPDSMPKKQDFIHRLFDKCLSLVRRSKGLLLRLRTFFASVAIIFLINLMVLDPAWSATSNGRAGGSFGRSTQLHPPISKSIRRSKADESIRAPTRVLHPPLHQNRNRLHRNFHLENGEEITGNGAVVITKTDGTTNYARRVITLPSSGSRISASGVLYVSSVAGVVANGVVRRKRSRKKYGGSGISVWCMTASLNVPNLNDTTSIVHRLQKLAETTSTETRKGLQTLLAESSLELLRQLEMGSIVSVESSYHNYQPSEQAVLRAERHFNRISTRSRSKFDREAWSSYNGSIVKDTVKKQKDSIGSVASFALVQIHLVIEGNTMKPFGERQMETRESFREALVQLSGDVKAVEDCVLAGEVIWAPQQLGQHEVLTEKDIYARYPTLWPISYSL